MKITFWGSLMGFEAHRARVVMDLNSDAGARVVALLAGAAQTMPIEDSGNQPDIILPKIESFIGSREDVIDIEM